MTIAHVGSTGVNTATAVRGTTSISVAYPASSVAAGRIAIIFAEGKLSSATWGTDPSGYTKIVDATGGTGSNGVDTGNTRIGIWYKVLSGSESGSETVALTSGTQVTAVMSVYSKTATNWVPPNATTGFVTGADSTATNNVSAALGSWPTALRTGDWVVAAFAATTDNTAAASSPTITQSGATFGTVTMRNRMGGSDGNDGSIYSWDASVTNGNENAPTVGFTETATIYGAAAAIRLREVSNVAVSTVSDNFNDNTIDTALWSINYGTTSETGGRARVETSTTYAGYYSEPKFSIDSTGSWAQIFPAAANGATTEAYTAYWFISPSQALGTDFGIAYEATTNEIGFTIRTGFSFDGGTVALTYNATDHAWWRIRYSSPNIIWETSPDGSTWTQRRSATAPAYVANTIDFSILFESHRAEGTTNFAEMDNFNVPQITVHNGDAALSGQSTLTASGIATAIAAATLTGQSTLTAVASNNVLAASVLSGQSTLTAVGANSVLAASILSGQSTLVTSASASTTGASVLSGQSTLTAVGTRGVNADSVLSGQSTLTAIGANQVNASVLLSGQSTMVTVANNATTAASVLSGQSTMVTVGSNNVLATSVLSGQSTLTVDALTSTNVTITLSGESALTVSASNATTGATVLSGQSTLTVTGTVTTSGTAVLSGQSTLTTVGIRGVNAESVLSGQSTLVADGKASTTAASVLSGQSTLTVSATVDVKAASVLSGQSTLVVEGIIGAVPPAANLSGQSTLTVVPLITSFGTSTLSGQSTLTVSGTVDVKAASVLSGQSTLSAIANNTAIANTTLSATGNLAVSAQATSSANVVLSGQSTLTITATVTQIASANLSANSSITVSTTVTTRGAVTLSGESSIVAIGTRIVLGTSILSGQSTLQVSGFIPAVITGLAQLAAQLSMQVIGHPSPPWRFPLIELGNLARASTMEKTDNVYDETEMVTSITSIEGG